MTTFLDIAIDAARTAGALQREKQLSGFQVEHKGRINLVTEVDKASEALIIGKIREHFPDHQILAEESGAHAANSPYQWVIDPLDGTTNYAHGYPCYAVSIALQHEGTTELGVVYDPSRDELFVAERGRGATCNGRSIHVSACADLEQALLATGFGYNVREVERNNLQHFCDFILCSQAVRRDGAAAIDLAYVACGRYDGFWELYLQPWDVAAGALLIQEAGGQVSLFDGSSLDIHAPEIIASNSKIHAAMRAVLQGKHVK